MSKFSYDDKINLYNERKKGVSIASLCSKYGIRHEIVEYLIRLIDKNGFVFSVKEYVIGPIIFGLVLSVCSVIWKIITEKISK